jgi:hypothetical protein
MGDHIMGHCQTRINLISPKVSKTTFVEIRRQPVGIEGTQSPNVLITTIRVEMVVAPNTTVVKGGILIGSATNLGHGSGSISIGRNLSRSARLLAISIGVLGTPQMVFTNLIMIAHVNRTVD